MNILITGAAQGIGAAIAKNLCGMENKLILIDLQQDKLKSFADEVRPQCKEIIELPGDLSNEEFIRELKDYIADNGVDILINNAAFAPKMDYFQNLTISDLDKSYSINIKAPFELLKSSLETMKRKGTGIIINVASRANIYGYYRMGIYSSAKAALTSFTGTIALENPGLKALTIIPGRTNTPLQVHLRGEDEAIKSQSPEYVGEIIAKVATGEIQVTSGDSVIIDYGQYKVVSELDKVDLHKNMH